MLYNINVNSRNFCFISRRIWSRDVPATSEVQRCSKLCKSLMIPSLLVLNWPASELFYLSGFSTGYNNLLQTKFEWWISKQKRGVKIVKSCLQKSNFTRKTKVIDYQNWALLFWFLSRERAYFQRLIFLSKYLHLKMSYFFY